MKKMILLIGLLLISGCSNNGRGNLVKRMENVSYIIKYETHTYDIVTEFDYETLTITKTESVNFEDVHYIQKDSINHYDLENEYLVYTNGKSFYIYYAYQKY